jgi:hypothetical protein
MSINGDWCCSALLEGISEEGAKLTLLSSFDDSDLNEFFLVLTKFGSVHRRCTRVRLNGRQLEAHFVHRKPERTRPRSFNRILTSA